MSDTGASQSGGGRRFILKRLVGAGAFGEVYLAEQDSGAGFTRAVALKLLNPDVAGSREAARRMRDEARILGRLSHRNIVSVLDLVRFGDRWGVVMDFVPGADLEEVLVGLDAVDAPFPAPAAFEVASAVCRALHSAYNASDGQGGTLKVVHRDIKPSNVRLTEDGEVKVLDFGVARVDLDTRESSTKAQGWIGTERFMAPERILMEGDTLAGDVYAVGVSLVELLLKDPLGRTPVLPDRHTPFVESALERIRPGLRGDAQSVEAAIALLRQLLAVDPNDRPEAVDACRQLAAVARGLEGESLVDFSHRFVPALAAEAEANSKVVEGVLSENTAITGSPSSAASSSTASLASADPTYFPVAEDDAPRRGRIGLWVGFVAAVLFALVGLFATVAVGLVLLPGRSGEVEQPTAVPSAPADVTDTAMVAPPSADPELPSPEPEPMADPDPVADPDPQPRPAPIAPVPVAPAPVVEVAAPVPAPDLTDVPRISRALVVMADASSVDVTCGDRSASGTSSVRIVDFPAGECAVRANYLGTTLAGTVAVDRATTVTCTPTDGGLSCSGS